MTRGASPAPTTSELAGISLAKNFTSGLLWGRMTATAGRGGFRMVGAGIQLGAVLIGGLSAGLWLDRRFGTAPVFLYGGVASGAIGGMTALVRQLNRITRDDEEARKR